MLRIENILAAVREHKTCSMATLYRYLKSAGVEPLGARQRPQIYPNDAALKVLAHLGIVSPAPATAAPTNGKNGHGLVSLTQLRAERKKARRSK